MEQKEKAPKGTEVKNSAKIVKEVLNPKGLDVSFSSSSQNADNSFTTSDEAQQSEWDRMADEFFADGEEGKQESTPTKKGLPDSFPVWHMPAGLQRVVCVVSKAYNADPTAAWISLLAVAMASLGKSCKGHFGNGKYDNWPTGWFVLVGSPGTDKSPIINWFARYLRQEEREAYKRYQAELAQWKSKSTPKKERGEEPKHRSLIAENVTDERLFQKCCENNGKLFWLGDEFDGLIGGLGMYSRNASQAIANMKKMYSQDDVSRDTMSRGPMLIENPALTILAATHPDMVVDLMRKFVSRGDGFFDRFLFVEINEQQPILEEPDISQDVVSTWYTYVEMMLHNKLSNIYEGEVAAEIRQTIKLNWYKQCYETGLLAKESGDWLTARRATLYKKAHYTLCRICVAVARLRSEDTITADTMRYCVEVTNFFIKQQSTILTKFGESKADTLTKRDVAQWLVKNLKGYSKADIGRFLYPSSDNPRQSLNYLING